MSRYSTGICWVRRDLRLDDHHALAEATAQCDRVAVVFVFDTKILSRREDRDDRRMTFIVESLREMDTVLRQCGSQLIVLHGDPVEEIPQLARQIHANAVFANQDFEQYAVRRDNEVRKVLAGFGVQFHSYKDQVVFDSSEVRTENGAPFRVYSPFARQWRKLLHPASISERKVESSSFWAKEPWMDDFVLPSYESLGFIKNDLWLDPGTSGAKTRLDWFVDRLDDYAENRDRLDIDGTSGLSVHLRHGTISIRECVRASLRQEGKGADKWLSELIWREFYQSILVAYPDVETTTFRPEFANLPWENREDLFEAWKQGRTGYPIVDAAMRCLNATGWMHNRLRMVVASFLTKDLLIDYRWGEAYFARYLLDFDLASNNGGWQWAASTGCDPQPYFRIFNPILQGLKFDPKGDFVRRWVPELSTRPDDKIHEPLAGDLFESEFDYPGPIVDHQIQRTRAVDMFAQAKL
ncbi:MAG: deoxyribodipyrimidine photo-lyase [Armatimonadetes bacterium]|nr:deoxyribodipyrimidine photo-lyase [Armatimonadota bacterium]